MTRSLMPLIVVLLLVTGACADAEQAERLAEQEQRISELEAGLEAATSSTVSTTTEATTTTTTVATTTTTVATTTTTVATTTSTIVTRTITGWFWVHEGQYNIIEIAEDRDGALCWGQNWLRDVREGASVIIRDGAGVVIGVASLSPGEWLTSYEPPECVFSFVATGLPDLPVYVIGLEGHGESFFDRSQLEANGWQVSMRLQ